MTPHVTASRSANSTRLHAHTRGDGEANSGTGVSDTSPAVCWVELEARFGAQTDRNRLARAVVRRQRLMMSHVTAGRSANSNLLHAHARGDGETSNSSTGV